MESHDTEPNSVSETTQKQKAAFRLALDAVGVTLTDETFNLLPLSDLRSIYTCVALNFEK